MSEELRFADRDGFRDWLINSTGVARGTVLCAAEPHTKLYPLRPPDWAPPPG